MRWDDWNFTAAFTGSRGPAAGRRGWGSWDDGRADSAIKSWDDGEDDIFDSTIIGIMQIMIIVQLASDKLLVLMPYGSDVPAVRKPMVQSHQIVQSQYYNLKR
ncbi:MAG: hypothetical protein GY820_04555 [Gammaproteobacteria bacterium]|nr:hypothetical protein [Gammaproteobacteria bacterium]